MCRFITDYIPQSTKERERGARWLYIGDKRGVVGEE